MSARARVWIVGLLTTATVAVSLARDEASGDLIGPVVLLALAVVALVAELSALRPGAWDRSGPRPVDGARPADGVVEKVDLRGVESSPNPWDPRLGRFVRLLEDEVGEGRRPVLATGAPAILGRVALLSVFIDLDGRAWTDREIAQGYKSLERAGVWIEREAILRGMPVNLELPRVYFQAEGESGPAVELEFVPEGDTFGPMEARATAKYLTVASRAAARLGFADAADLVGRINRRIDADAHAWLLHVRGAGRSLAIPAAESEMAGVGLAVCFSREASFPEPLSGGGRVDALTVVHELLHLFGATDKYGVELSAFPGDSVGPDDVMRMDHESLSRLRIEDLTASEIGWGRSTRSPRRKTPAGDGSGPRRAGMDSG